MAIRVEADRVVTLVYRLTDSEGNLLEERTPEKPYEYIHGHGQLLPALERLVEGKTPGFQTEVQLSPRDGYGEYDPRLVVEVPRSKFPAGLDIEPGLTFSTTGPSGGPIAIRVIEVDDKVVTVDGNHPLAGLDLVFEVRVLDVRETTEEERETGQLRAENEFMADDQPTFGTRSQGGEDEGKPKSKKSKSPSGNGSGTLH